MENRVSPNCVPFVTSTDLFSAIDPGQFEGDVLRRQVSSDCAIATNDFVQLLNEPEKSSIDVLSPQRSAVFHISKLAATR